MESFFEACEGAIALELETIAFEGAGFCSWAAAELKVEQAALSLTPDLVEIEGAGRVGALSFASEGKPRQNVKKTTLLTVLIIVLNHCAQIKYMPEMETSRDLRHFAYKKTFDTKAPAQV